MARRRSCWSLGSQAGPCAAPSAASVESEDYRLAISLYVYVNRASLAEKPSLDAFMQIIVDPANAGLIAATGATPPSDAIYDFNAKLLADANAEPGMTGSADDFQMPPGLSGDIRIAGAATADQIISRAAANLGEAINAQTSYVGAEAGLERLCQGEADIAVLNAPASADSLATCADAGIATATIELGWQASVLLAHAADDYAACLTSEQIKTIWRADPAGAVMRWSDIDDSLPDQSLILFGMRTLDSASDLLLRTAGELIPPLRRDTEKNNDPHYRAAAVANVSGSLTYMSWQDAQSVMVSDPERVAMVAVDAGAGCAQAGEESIVSGAYPLSLGAHLLVAEAALADAKTQALLWQIHSDDNWAAMQADGFISAPALELPILRRELLRQFADAELAHAPIEAAAESETDSDSDADAENSG